MASVQQFFSQISHHPAVRNVNCTDYQLTMLMSNVHDMYDTQIQKVCM